MGPENVKGEIRKQIKIFIVNEKQHSDVNKQEWAMQKKKTEAVSVLEVKRVMWSECCKEWDRDNVMRIYKAKNKLNVWSLDKANVLPHEPWGAFVE